MRKISGFAWAMSVLLSVLPAIVFGHDHDHGHEDSAPPVFQSASLFNLTDSWTDRQGKVFRLEDFRGQATVIAMIYTSCPDVCPLIVEDMKVLQRQLPTPCPSSMNMPSRTASTAPAGRWRAARARRSGAWPWPSA